jgi:hypothetical protein
MTVCPHPDAKSRKQICFFPCPVGSPFQNYIIGSGAPPGDEHIASLAERGTVDRTYYTESTDPYYLALGVGAATRERYLVGLRHEEARRRGLSYLEVDVEYLITRRKETLYRWFALLKWLRQGLLKSTDPARRAMPGGMSVQDTGACVQTHRADVEDCQAAHLMHCNLQFIYRGRRCEAYEFLKGGRDSTRDYKAFTKNIFAATVNVFSIVNEIDSFLETNGAKAELAALTAIALRTGLDPVLATDTYLNSYKALIQRCKTNYPDVIEEYQAGSSSLEARIAKDQHLSAYLKKRRKYSLFDVYHDKVQGVRGPDPAVRNMVDRAYRSRHEEWGTAPNRLL